jgi:hypothetical protein
VSGGLPQGTLEVPLPMLPGLDASVKIDLNAATQEAKEAAAAKFAEGSA